MCPAPEREGGNKFNEVFFNCFPESQVGNVKENKFESAP